jgi:hypothetical protein
MKTFGVVLLILGVAIGLLFNWLAGAVLAIIGLLLVIAGKPGERLTTCASCGNPVARTANICPTCHAALVPTEGPLVPKPAEIEQDEPRGDDESAWSWAGRSAKSRD